MLEKSSVPYFHDFMFVLSSPVDNALGMCISINQLHGTENISMVMQMYSVMPQYLFMPMYLAFCPYFVCNC